MSDATPLRPLRDAHSGVFCPDIWVLKTRKAHRLAALPRTARQR
jgi:hypothetical protein